MTDIAAILVGGGIYTGLFTPTEAAAVGTFCSISITFFVYRTVKLRDMSEILADTVNRWLIFIGINIVLLALGCVLETVSIILITLPMLCMMMEGRPTTKV